MSSERGSIIHWRTRSIAMVCVLFGGLGVASILLTVRAERDAARLEHLRSVARMGTAAIQSADQGGLVASKLDLFRRWSWTVMSDGHVLGAALFDADGQLRDVQPQDLVAGDMLADAVAQGASTIDCGQPIGRTALVGRQIGEKPSVWVIGARRRLAAPVNSMVALCAAVMAVALLLVLFLLRNSFDKTILAPLEAINRAIRVGGERFRFQLPMERADEFGAVARNIDRMIEEHEIARSRMGSMERTIDARVADQTKRIQGMLKQAKLQAWIDPLTGLGNRRLLDDRLEELFSAQRANREDMSIIMFDLDNFKGLNDTLGHAAGDEVLSFVGELLRCTLRPSDIGLRCGGDEFAAILLDTNAADAARMAERFAKLFAQRASLYEVSPAVSLSAGVASLHGNDPENGAGLLTLADVALYQAKRAGKARVRIVNNTPASSPIITGQG